MSTESAARKAAQAAAEYFRPSGVPKHYADNAVKVHAERLLPIMEQALATTCQTVASPPESKRTFTSEEWYAMFCKKCGGATNYATVNAGRGVCRCPEQPKTGSAPAVSTPRCPVCKSLRVQFYFGDGDVLFACRECGHQATGKEITDLVRVFQPAPSPPQCNAYSLNEQED